jgi:hypothetical protein
MYFRLSTPVLVIATATCALLPVASWAQTPERIGEHPNLNGIWQVMNTANWNLEGQQASAHEEFWRLGALAANPAGKSVVREGKLPYLPDALVKRDENRAGWPRSDPETGCYLPGIPRATYLPHPFQIIQGDEDILFAYAFASANRNIYMTEHKTLDEVPVDLWMGWSNGSWDGDTLVIEVLANDDRTWLDRAGNYHSNQMKVTERYTLLDPNRIQYEATIDDPQVYSAPWTIEMILYRHTEPDAELLEFKCVAFAESMLYGELFKEPPQ